MDVEDVFRLENKTDYASFRRGWYAAKARVGYLLCARTEIAKLRNDWSPETIKVVEGLLREIDEMRL